MVAFGEEENTRVSEIEISYDAKVIEDTVSANEQVNEVSKARTKTVFMSLETKPKKFPCIKISSSVELKRQKIFLPSNIINILIDLFYSLS